MTGKSLSKWMILLALSGLALAGCSRERVPEKERKEISDLSKNNPYATEKAKAMVGALDDTNSSACSRLNEITSLNADSSRQFQFFGGLELKKEGLIGSVNLHDSPLMQIIAATKINVPTAAEVIAKREGDLAAMSENDPGHAEMKAGVLLTKCFAYLGYPEIKPSNWDTLPCHQLDPKYSVLSRGTVQEAQEAFYGKVYPATNDVVAEKFPGIFGEPTPAGRSLHFLLGAKALFFPKKPDLSDGGSKVPRSPKLGSIVTSKLPLFSSKEWSEVKSDTYQTLAAAKNGVYNTEKDAATSSNEKLCGMVLYHRSFSQLLSLSGHIRPLFADETELGSGSALEKFSSANPEVQPVPVLGAFTDAKTKQPVLLEPEMISGYDPKTRLLLPPRSTELGSLAAPQKPTPANLEAYLSLLETLVAHYIATSPAEPWVDNPENYFLGDISSLENKAFLPDKAHSLALGLLTMNFKNLGALYIREINGQKSLKKEGEKTAGVVLGESEDLRKGLVKLKMSSLVSLVKTSSYLGLALDRLSEKNPEDLEKQNPAYTRKTLAKLLGEKMFKKEELDGLLSEPEKASVLYKKLGDLNGGLSLLILDLLKDDKCYSELDWDLNQGTQKHGELCSTELKKELKSALVKLSQRTDAPILLYRANQIK